MQPRAAAPVVQGLGDDASRRLEAPEWTQPTIGLPASYQGPRTLPALGDRAFVLCWHSFLGRADLPTDFSLVELGRQLDALLALGYRFVSVEDMLFGRIRGPLNLVATLDDGHRTVPAAYLKVFASRNIVPGLFIYPSVIGTTGYSMDQAQLRELRDLGCPIGAHGYYHLYVTEALYRSDRVLFDKEIFRAKTRVEELADFPVYLYAYPFGALSPITKAEVARAGYNYAFAVKGGFVYADSRLNDPYELPRSVVTRDNWPQLLEFLKRNAAGAER